MVQAVTSSSLLGGWSGVGGWVGEVGWGGVGWSGVGVGGGRGGEFSVLAVPRGGGTSLCLCSDMFQGSWRALASSFT